MRFSLRRLTVLAAALAATACSSDSGTAPASRETYSLSQLLGEFAAPGLASVGSVTGSPVVPSAGLTAACPFVTASQSFACPTISASGITATQSYVLLFASGTALSAFDAATVAAIRIASSMAGTISAPSGPITIGMQQSMTLSGVLTGAHTLNGNSVTHLAEPSTATSPGETIDVTTTYTNVVLRASASATSYPLSGTITSALLVKTGTTTDAATVTITFNGTSKVPVSIVDGGVTVRCTIDLASNAPSCS